MQTTRLSVWATLLGAVVLHGALLLPPALLRRELHHDEAITLLAATTHQGEYEAITATKTPPYGAWAPAEAWKRMLAHPSAARPDLGRIARDLAALDLHPPLYFWLLSLVTASFGTQLAVGLGLNLALDIGTLIAIFLLARRICRDERAAAAASLLWGLSPGPLEAALEMRQYSLLGLLSALWALAISRAADAERRFTAPVALALAVIAGLGMLAHYHFAILIGAGLLVVFVSLVRTDRRRALFAALAGAAGFSLGLAAHPDFLAALARQGAWADRFAAADIVPRIYKVLVATGHFFVWGVPFQIAWVVALVVAAGITLRARRRVRGAISALLAPAPPGVVLSLVMLALVFFAQVALFLLFRSPSGAMRPKYLASVYPLMASLVAWAILHPRTPRRVSWAAFGLAALSALVLVGNELVTARFVAASLPVVTSARRIVVDTAARGSLPLTLAQVSDDTPVFVASQADLLASPDRFFAELGPDTFVVIDPAFGSVAGKEALVRRLKERYEVSEVHVEAWRRRVVYRLLRFAPHTL